MGRKIGGDGIVRVVNLAYEPWVAIAQLHG